MVVAATGRVLLDSWHSFQHRRLTFVDADSRAEMSVQNVHHTRKCFVDIDFSNATFSFKENPAVRHPLAKLPEMISLL